MNAIDEFAARLVRLEDAVRRMSHPQLAYSSIEDGSIGEYDRDGTLGSRIGKQWDGTHVAASLNGPTPPTPTMPSGGGDFGGIAVTWDGFFEPDQTTIAPMDFARVEVHVGDTDDFDASTADTLRTTFETSRGGTKFVAAGPGTRHVRLVTRTLSGKASPASATASVVVEDPATLAGGNTVTYGEAPPTTPGATTGDLYFHVTGSGSVLGQYVWDGTDWAAQPIESDAIAGLAVGKLIAGTLAADTAIIAGDPAGAHVRIDGSEGITAQNAAATRTFSVDSATGDVALVGTLATGLAGARVEIEDDRVTFFADQHPANVELGTRAYLNPAVGEVQQVNFARQGNRHSDVAVGVGFAEVASRSDFTGHGAYVQLSDDGDAAVSGTDYATITSYATATGAEVQTRHRAAGLGGSGHHWEVGYRPTDASARDVIVTAKAGPAGAYPHEFDINGRLDVYDDATIGGDLVVGGLQVGATGTALQRVRTGSFNANVNASAYIEVTHGLGATPSFVVVSAASGYHMFVGFYTSTTFRVTAFSRASGNPALANGTNIQGSYLAIA